MQSISSFHRKRQIHRPMVVVVGLADRGKCPISKGNSAIPADQCPQRRSVIQVDPTISAHHHGPDCPSIQKTATMNDTRHTPCPSFPPSYVDRTRGATRTTQTYFRGPANTCLPSAGK
ncbi:hypothetical protein VTJ04DRAFT_3877 [Mycothermus thermophilus]|uniref:uncharacterized protein n=1 Tax=Humicola insolens TaxID=85995 RepID=UPI0037426169